MSPNSNAVFRTDLPDVPLLARGKVRDVYDLGEWLLLVSTDRLSAFDHVFSEPIPDKGRVLNGLSAFWFERSSTLAPNHLVATDVSVFPEALRRHARILEGRSALVRKLRMIPIECVARGYLAGSGWKEYREQGTVCGIRLPVGLRESDRLPEPIFTPATKAETGHDINISFAEVVGRIGDEMASRLRRLTLDLYRSGSEYAASRGILVADTKFEFGVEDGRLVVADEMLTPDSSRFWPADRYAPGGPQPSLDKQFVRDWLESIGWDKSPPIPPLPPDVVAGARSRYREIYRILTGREVDAG